MYVVVRVMKVQKGFSDKITEGFLSKNAMSLSPGFVRSVLMVDKKNPEYDLYRQEIFWLDKKAFFVWEGSPEHIMMHKEKKNQEKPEEIIEFSRETYEVLASK